MSHIHNFISGFYTDRSRFNSFLFFSSDLQRSPRSSERSFARATFTNLFSIKRELFFGRFRGIWACSFGGFWSGSSSWIRHRRCGFNIVQDNSEVKTKLEEAHKGRFDSGVDSLATELATDIVVNVGDVIFYLHKFYYGMMVTLNAYNVVATRCALEYLEMYKIVEKGNLITRSNIFRSWKDSIIILQTTKSLLPWTKELKVVSHCLDSIASKGSIETSKVE
ncbi:hypothetical protein HYC85_005550 [Camellia sinensis]|uniref:Uncharacterized protein n=1 Tax=Camellia sinensis TaxID=4442 RepID=A0A7J7I0Q9_CAMSI|nr:hypothetical protein HYC85_005550 [Camellia sinensis]